MCGMEKVYVSSIHNFYVLIMVKKVINKTYVCMFAHQREKMGYGWMAGSMSVTAFISNWSHRHAESENFPTTALLSLIDGEYALISF